MKWMNDVIKEHADTKDRFHVICTGLPDLDDVAPLIRRGTVSLLGSRPGMGRSTLAAQIAANIADSDGYVGWFATVRSIGEVMEKIFRVKPDFRCPQNIALEDRVGDGRELRQAVEELDKRIDLVIYRECIILPAEDKRCLTRLESVLICGTLPATKTYPCCCSLA